MVQRTLLLVGAGLAVSALALGGCTDLKRAIGLEKVVPDEFAVTTRAPLALPPDYSLRPPRPGEARPQEISPTQQAKDAVFRIGAPKEALPPPTTARSPGETALLREAGAQDAPTDIRQLVNNEAEKSDAYSDSFVDKLLFWHKGNPVGATDETIDPEAEAERLAQAKAAGRPPTSGPPSSLAGTPTIEQTTKSSWFGWLF